MRVGLCLFYPGTLWSRGGGETFAETIYAGLRAAGQDVELVDPWRPGRYDLLHLIGSSHHVADVVAAAKATGARVVVSPCAYSARPAWEWALWRHADRLVPVDTTYRCRTKLFLEADHLLPSTHAEAAQLRAYFGVPPEKITVLPYPCETRLAASTPEAFLASVPVRDFVLMVARINRIKGQIRLMQALDGTGLPVVFVGGADPNDADYFPQFLQACRARPWVHHAGPIPHDAPQFGSALAAARVHALVSANEYPGIVSIEAGLAGTNVVSPDSPVSREYLGEDAVYCRPQRLASIRQAVLRAYDAPRDGRLQRRLLRLVDPHAVTQQLLQVYARAAGAPAAAPEVPECVSS